MDSAGFTKKMVDYCSDIFKKGFLMVEEFTYPPMVHSTKVTLKKAELTLKVENFRQNNSFIKVPSRITNFMVKLSKEGKIILSKEILYTDQESMAFSNGMLKMENTSTMELSTVKINFMAKVLCFVSKECFNNLLVYTRAHLQMDKSMGS